MSDAQDVEKPVTARALIFGSQEEDDAWYAKAQMGNPDPLTFSDLERAYRLAREREQMRDR